MQHCVLVYIELDREKNILPESLEALNAAARVAEIYGSSVSAVVIGTEVTQAAEDILRMGPQNAVDKIHVMDAPGFETYQPERFQMVLENLISKIEPSAVLFPQTWNTVDLAPRISFSLEAGLVTDCIAVEPDQGRPLFIKPIYSGNVLAGYQVPAAPAIVVCRPKSFSAAEKNHRSAGEVIMMQALEQMPGSGTKIVEQVFDDGQTGIPLSQADIIVSGGRGMGGPRGFALLSELAERLGGALGASRPPCDLEWVSPKTQVGVTGDIVAPSLYIAVGISGSFQHMAGMMDSKTVVAINRDEGANIFKIADYGIVSEYEDVIPAIIDAIKAREIK